MAPTTTVSVLVTGSEVLDGRVLDTNSHYVGEQLSRLGLRLGNVLSCDDDLSEMARCLSFLTEQNRIVITSGGLGPTADDLTRKAVADFCGVPLEHDTEAVKHLEEFFARRNRILEESNLQQALLPRGSTIIANPVGTAPGFIARARNGALIMSLSGVPHEFTRMFDDTVLPKILSELADAQIQKVAGMKIFGLPESVVGKLIKKLDLPREISVSYRAFFPEVHIALKGFVDDIRLLEMRNRVHDALGHDFVFTHDLEGSFEASVLRALISKHKTIATAESCTGGIISAMLTNQPGSSSVFLGGVCSYSNDAKEIVLGVRSETLSTFGAVSSEVAEEMAGGVRKKLAASVGLSVTGIAGPDGGSTEKPVGTFFIGVSLEERTFSQRYFYVGSRSTIRRFAAYAALDVVRRSLDGFQIPASLPHVP